VTSFVSHSLISARLAAAVVYVTLDDPSATSIDIQSRHACEWLISGGDRLPAHSSLQPGNTSSPHFDGAGSDNQ
jgi:hypothetical protein